MLSHRGPEPSSLTPVPTPLRRAGRRAAWARWGLVCLLGLTVTFFLILAVVYPMRRILPGVYCLGVDLSGKTRSQAAAALEENWQRRTILLKSDDAEWVFSPVTLGLTLDPQTTVETAFQRGRSMQRLGARLQGRERFEVEPTVVYDAASVQRHLSSLRSQIDLEPVSRGLRLVEGQIEVTPSKPGRTLDLAATAIRLQGAPAKIVQMGYLNLVIVPLPAPVVDLESVVNYANAWLANTLAVKVFDPISGQTLTWYASPQQWIEWVSLSIDHARLEEGASALDWEFDVQAARAALDAQMSAWISGGQLDPSAYVPLDEGATAMRQAVMQEGWLVHLRVYHHGSQHTVRSGETLSSIAGQVGIPYPWIQQANPGVSDDLHVGQVIQVPSPDVMLPLPVVENKRIVVSISRQRMWAYQDGTLIWEWAVSTGIPSSPTAPGVFQVQSHDGTAYAASWDLWMPHFMGIYRPVPSSSFMNGFHGFPTRDGATLLWTGDLGHPVTFGCILLETGNAALLYEWAEDGVVVEIQQ